LSEAQIRDLPSYDRSSAYDPFQKTVIRFADEWTRQNKASPQTVQELSKQLTPAQLVVLAATVGLANWTNRFNESFAVELP
jgi:alkylhydroperoxidase family enzyme